MNSLLAQFHFLRPWWLLAMIPALLLIILLWQRKNSAANWRSAIAPELIDHLLEATRQARPKWPWLLLTGWLLAVFALAGPTWEKLPQPVLQKRDGFVIVLDLSLSMYAEDIKPSRLQRARFKIIDILKQRREGLTGLVVYSADAHVVSPLTDDTATIENLVPALAPAIMPEFGSDAAAGVETALQLLRNSGFERGRILLLSDEIGADDIDKIAAAFTATGDGKNWQLSILGVGTEQGAPIPLPRAENRAGSEKQTREPHRGGFLQEDSGTIVIAQLHRDRFSQLAAKVNGRYSDIQIDDRDIDQLLSTTTLDSGAVRTLEREFDQWRERGPQLVMLLLPIAAFAFRRGWLVLIFLMPFSSPSQAWEWRDLWLRPDQQAQQNFAAGNSKAAAEEFQHPQWRAAAQYRSGEYAAAARSLQRIDTADAHYNRGNALAHAGKLEEALSAYDAALTHNPSMEDAKANRDLVEKLLQQQKESKNNSSSKQPNQNSSRQDSDRQNAQQNQSQQAQQNQSQSQQQMNGEAQETSPAQPDERNQSSNDRADTEASEQKGHADNEPPADNQNEERRRATESDEQQEESEPARAGQEPEPSEQAQNQPETEQRPSSDKLTPEQERQQRATEQWLRQVPDDPSGLLRRKFMHESQQRDRQPQNDGKPLW